MTHRGVGSAGGISRSRGPGLNSAPRPHKHDSRLPVPFAVSCECTQPIFVPAISPNISHLDICFIFVPRPIFVLIPHLSYINTGLLVPATGATAANQYLRSGHRYSQTNSSLDIFTIANPESPQSHRNAMHKYSNPPESNMDLDLSKTLISLRRTLFTFLTFPILVRRKFTASSPPLSLSFL